jgi:chromosomal replication initiator protein
MAETTDLWNKFVTQLKSEVSNATFNAWFSRMKLKKVNDGVAIFGCADSFVREMMESKHKKLVSQVLNGLVDEDNVTVNFVIDEDFLNKTEDKEEGEEKDGPLFKADSKKQKIQQKISRASLNSRYTFENLVVGPSNRLAHAATEAVTEKLGQLYNPIFIYGGVGLGKTHLMHALGNRVLQLDPDKEVYYCAIERFLNEMVEAIRSGRKQQFRKKYRDKDVLLIDDIQFISSWAETQNELFHTFNEIHLSNRQLVFASDRPPAKIPNLMDRLKSRFQGGMVVDVAPPTFEMKVAILKKKCEQNLIHLPEEIIVTIAQYVDSNIRELEGALNRIYNRKNVTGVVPNTEEVKEILEKDMQQKRQRVDPKFIISEVAKEFNVKIKDLKGKSRKAEISLARQVAMFLVRKELKYKLADTANCLNRKDHTTAINAVEKVEDEMKEDSNIREKIERLRRRVSRKMV